MSTARPVDAQDGVQHPAGLGPADVAGGGCCALSRTGKRLRIALPKRCPSDLHEVGAEDVVHPGRLARYAASSTRPLRAASLSTSLRLTMSGCQARISAAMRGQADGCRSG